MAKELSSEGLKGSPTSIQVGATRPGGVVLIHPYSPHYDLGIHAEFKAGLITTQDLKNRIQKNNAAPTTNRN